MSEKLVTLNSASDPDDAGGDAAAVKKRKAASNEREAADCLRERRGQFAREHALEKGKKERGVRRPLSDERVSTSAALTSALAFSSGQHRCLSSEQRRSLFPRTHFLTYGEFGATGFSNLDSDSGDGDCGVVKGITIVVVVVLLLMEVLSGCGGGGGLEVMLLLMEVPSGGGGSGGGGGGG
eukprot:6198726-Pleurochrysis_carterae.AAC.1